MSVLSAFVVGILGHASRGDTALCMGHRGASQRSEWRGRTPLAVSSALCRRHRSLLSFGHERTPDCYNDWLDLARTWRVGVLGGVWRVCDIHLSRVAAPSAPSAFCGHGFPLATLSGGGSDSGPCRVVCGFLCMHVSAASQLGEGRNPDVLGAASRLDCNV